ncbi:hypothetical protein GCM10018793_11810 [Streptomyces sulfonofaciens]|uniref:non-specific serine/threonine protein kinase n=1 Tax=Streptomyces sulfonofaciens TaxID=68272 RepID=A0A919KVJ9_9ACTN|nr:protein kinase [Streptomyces sulfonofaciens]GHH73301.1 hypothetical protein GCM10018793_11810 [Streptomyces sulfonofaciens]
MANDPPRALGRGPGGVPRGTAPAHEDAAATPEITLSVLSGPGAGGEFTFTERTACVVGRAAECRLRLPRDDARAARHHCLLDISPPDIRIRDLGAPHGTLVNGEEIGRPGDRPGVRCAERDLADGDEVRLGATLLRVGIRAPGPAAPAGRCAHCAPAGGPAADRRPGDVMCPDCRSRPLSVLRGLLARAAGDDALAALRGYEVVRELGRGALGAVYLARHRGTGERVALKLLAARTAVGPRARARFLAEAERLRGVRHWNILGLHAAAAHGAAFCLVGEYAAGGTLQDLLAARGGTLPPGEAVAVAVRVLDALAHAHTAPRGEDGAAVAHRDVKPSNILLTGGADDDAEGGAARGGAAEGTVPHAVGLGDFGIAAAFERAGLAGLPPAGDCGGSVAYLPRVHVVDRRGTGPEADVWATAAVLYRMLTGAVPREVPPGADPLAVLLREPVVPVRRRDPAVPRRLAQVIDAALIDTPRIVTTSAGELRTALAAALR